MDRASHDILYEIFVAVLLNEGLEVLGRSLSDSVHINQIKFGLVDRHILYKHELLLSELDLLALFDNVVPAGELLTVDGFEK